ncbi:MAG TPA: AarF/UbiB family protein [Thermoanaerobaculia bacterium]|jgi:ubiquinone biosynthesis protein
MHESTPAAFARIPDPPKPGDEPVYGEFVDTGGHGLLRRFLATQRHLTALALGGLAAWLRSLPRRERRRLWVLLLRLVSAPLRLGVNRELRRQPFPVQLRRRLEMLGPTYVKLGQILSMREDLLPRPITDELKNLLDRLPAVPYERFLELVRGHLGRPVVEVFAHVRSTPLGSASIGQIHLATTLDGEQVILKVVKPGIRATLRRDTALLRLLGVFLQLFLGRYQPRRVIREFCEYTLREVDLSREADNAETFAASFRDMEGVVFPRVYRELSSAGLLVQEYVDGIKPTEPRARELREEDRRRLVELGAEAIIRMLYRDGFFHADLHPGNLLVLPGPKCAFIDLGMVGRFDSDLKRGLLYYYFSLVMGDAESAASSLATIAETGPGSDPAGFRRDVEDVCRRWAHRARFNQYSLGRLILESVGKAARHRMYFPVEMVLMVKALVTFEAVGHVLLGDFDVAQLSRKYVNRILLERFGGLRLAQESLSALPELADALAKTPRLVTEGLKLVEQAVKRPPAANPVAGMRATLFGGFCLVAGAILAGFDGPWPLWTLLMIVGVLLPLRRGK